MKKMIFFSIALLLAVGCKTTETAGPAKPLRWRQQQAYLKTVRDPRIFGMSLHQTPFGVEVRGGGRLHRRQTEALTMEVSEPFRPVVKMIGAFGQDWPVLIDLTVSQNWMEFDVAQKMGAHAIAEKDPVLLTLPGEEGVVACLSTFSAIRLGQLHVEHPLVYVRLATGSIGPMARKIESPVVKGVIGWNALRQFDLIQFNYMLGTVIISTVEETYEPHPDLLVATLPIEKSVGACMVRGKVNGKEGVIAIDPAGDFEVAIPQGTTLSTLELGGTLTLSSPKLSESSGGVRVGARFLQKYLVTICPQSSVIYLEMMPVAGEE